MTERTGFTVRWVIQVDAQDATEAAQLAASMARDPESTATVFEVVVEELEDDPNVEWTTVDVPWD